MKILELSKSYCSKEYDGNFQKMIDEEDGVIYDDYRIKKAYNRGNGTPKDFKRYMENNRKYCLYYDMENHMFI